MKMVTKANDKGSRGELPEDREESWEPSSFWEQTGSVGLLSGNNDGSPRSSRKVGPPPLKPGVDYVNPQEEDQMEIYGYKYYLFLDILTWCLVLLTLGIVRLVFHWRPQWRLFCTHMKCNLEEAEKVMLVDHYNQIFVENIVTVVNESSINGLYGDNVLGQDIPADKAVPNSLVRLKPNGLFEPTESLSFFENKKIRYLWDNDAKEYLKIAGLDKDVDCSYFYEQEGLSIQEQGKRRVLFGGNEIVVEVQTIVQILFNEVLGPFYVFQVFSIILWGFEHYTAYASCIVVMSTMSLVSSVIQIRRNQKQLRDTVQGLDTVSVCRGKDEYEEVESATLVPGDVIAIPAYGCVMQCDAVVISGNVIVNESMLTGESVPVTKTPLPHNTGRKETYNSKEHSKHTLFCGTKVIQTRFYDGAKVKAVVLRTGFTTAKGELIGSIMFPKPVDFKFNRHIYKFIRWLAALAAIGFIYTVILKYQRRVPASQILLKALDLITIIIPPALPMAMTIGVIFAQARLKASSIYCISPRSINISGCINCICFDKTGTLTEDDLSFYQVVPHDPSSGRFGLPITDPADLNSGPLLTCLATCHSLTIIDGNIIGDPLDQKMFEATQWELEEPDVNDTNKYDLLAPTVVKPKRTEASLETTGDEVGILRQFTFSSSLQRMSVVARNLQGSEFVLYCKGAPEVISSLCAPESLPDDFSEILMEYTQKGYRVLALTQRTLKGMSYAKMQRAAREDLENKLDFVGLLVMGNMLKPETKYVIETLVTASIRTVMVTGDNMLTALSVARECSMVQLNDKVVLLETCTEEEGIQQPRLKWTYADQVKRKESLTADCVKLFIQDENEENLHVAITGKTFRVLREYYPNLLNKVAIRGTVFARMAPEQKQQLIELLQDLGYYVGMCGDGANDCGALKAAHAGVSLSETEASVASPFTSKTPNISCIPILIREGRTSLVTAFGILKYMACYSIIQFVSVIILYTLYTNLTDIQFLYEDLFLISLFCVVFGRTQSFEQLARKPPPSSLIGLMPLASLGLQVILIIGFQLAAMFILWMQPWYKSHAPADENDLASHDNYAIFAVSVFQYITLAVVFSKGAPYRKPIYTNYSLLFSLVVMTVVTVYLVVMPFPWLADAFEFKLDNVDYTFRSIMVGLASIHFILAFVTESFIVDYLIFYKLKSNEWFKSMTSSETMYQKIFNETKTLNWLPSSSEATSSFTSMGDIKSQSESIRGEEKQMRPDLKSAEDQLTPRNGFIPFSGAVCSETSSCKASPPESGICVSFPVSAPVSPGLPMRSDEALCPEGAGELFFRSFSAIPCHESYSKGVENSPTSFSSPSESCTGSDFCISSHL